MNRSELMPSEFAEHLAKRKELWEARGKPGATCPTLGGRGNAGFATYTAEKAGVDKRTVNRAISPADAIHLSVRAKIKGTKLDTGVYLDSIKFLLAL